MGLDMYLEGQKFLAYIEEPDKQPIEDGYKVKERILELGYWRKHPNLHGYIVETFADGVDECQAIDLTEKMLGQIIEAVKARELPTTTGFFFGESCGSPDEIQRDVEILEAARKWLSTKEDHIWKSVSYRASW